MGWQHLDYRDWHQDISARLPGLRWQGSALRGRSIVFVYEGGYGDVIQFCRYVPLLRQCGAVRVDVLCHPPLKALLASQDGVSDVIGYDEDGSSRAWDYWVPALSLPRLFSTRLDNIPAEVPYLHASHERIAAWRAEFDRLCPGDGLRVGLVWQGWAEFENDAERSLPGLETLADLWQVAGVQFYSLQKGLAEQALLRWPASLPLVDLAPGLHDFADTAAAIEQLDLLISVDAAVAHLAGALGKACWVLLPAFMTDWRWLQERADTPWYPVALRLFRQLPHAGWAPVVIQLSAALAEWAQLRCSSLQQ